MFDKTGSQTQGLVPMIMRILLIACLAATCIAQAQPQPNTPQATTATHLPASSAPVAPTLLSSPTIADMGTWQMFVDADVVVKLVMVFLALCSVLTWSILLEKSLLFYRLNRRCEQFLVHFRREPASLEIGRAMNQIDDNPMRRMWQAAKMEWDDCRRTQGPRELTPHQSDRLIQRMALSASVVQEQELSRLGKSMGLLATIGSTSPFIGLFGTVWGILHSFAHIAASKSTSLAVVAPGIAEALLATAIGLFAAIPAVIIYNKFARDISKITGALDNFTAEFTIRVSRELAKVA